MQFSKRIIVHLCEKGCFIYHSTTYTSAHGTYNWRPTSYLPSRLSWRGHDNYGRRGWSNRSGDPGLLVVSRKRSCDTRVGGDTNDNFCASFGRISHVSILQVSIKLLFSFKYFWYTCLLLVHNTSVEIQNFYTSDAIILCLIWLLSELQLNLL